jgi:hypothetical protein
MTHCPKTFGLILGRESMPDPDRAQFFVNVRMKTSGVGWLPALANKNAPEHEKSQERDCLSLILVSSLIRQNYAADIPLSLGLRQKKGHFIEE